MKNTLARISIASAVGLIVYAAYLVIIVGANNALNPSAGYYWMIPLPGMMPDGTLQTQLDLLWRFRRTEIIAMWLGLAFPAITYAWVWRRTSRLGSRFPRWPTAAVLAVASIGALFLIIEFARSYILMTF